MNHKLILKEIEHNLTVAIGAMSLVEGGDEDSQHHLDYAKAQLVGVVHGIRNIVDHMPANEPMTLGALEKTQFERAHEIEQDFVESNEQDATWGN